VVDDPHLCIQVQAAAVGRVAQIACPCPFRRFLAGNPQVAPKALRLTAAAREDGRAAGQTHTLFLAPAGRGPSDATPFWSPAGQDRNASIASAVGELPRRLGFEQRAGRREEKVSEQSGERGAGSCLVILIRGKAGPFRPRWKLPTLKTRLAIVWAGGQLYNLGLAGVHNGNSGFHSWPNELDVIPVTLAVHLAGVGSGSLVSKTGF
jgi:hypothetical protein